MQEIKNPAGQGQGFKTGRGGDPKIRKKNMAENDIYVKLCHISAGLVNPLFMPFYGITALSLQSSFLPNRETQLLGVK